MRQGRPKESERPTLAPDGDRSNLSTDPPGRSTWGPVGRTNAPTEPYDTSNSMPGAVCAGDVLDGRFRLVRRIGTGGMSEVWEALHVRLDRPLAVKVVNLGCHEDTGARLLREAKTLARVQHENVVEIVDFGRTPLGAPFLVMELLRGESLQTLIEQQGPFDWRRAKQLGLQIVAGLVAAHGAGVLHRDVKPGNVFILQTAQGERVKLIDFGISRAHTLSPDATALTNLGELIGTPAFMAPEQIHGRSVDVRSDIYAMGCLLYAMLVGQSPFLGSTTAETLYRQLYEDPPPLRSSPRGAEIPVSVEAVIQRALRKSPELRYPTMHDLYAALDAATATSAKTLVPNEILPMPSPELRARYRTEPSMSLPVPSQPLAPTQATAPKKRSSAAPWAAGAIVAVAAISATAWSLGVPSVGEQSPSTDPATVLPTPQEPEPSTAPPAHAPPPPPEVPSPTAVVESPVSQPPAVELDEGNDGVADSEPAVAAPAPRPRPRRPPRPSSPPATSELAPTAEPPPPQTQVPSGVRPSKGDKDSREDIKDPWGAGPKNPWANE